MTDKNMSITKLENHNSSAVLFQGRHFETIRHKQVRNHCRVYHQFNDVPPLHIPAGLEGVDP